MSMTEAPFSWRCTWYNGQYYRAPLDASLRIIGAYEPFVPPALVSVVQQGWCERCHRTHQHSHGQQTVTRVLGRSERKQE